jgi:hypothetical protein
MTARNQPVASDGPPLNLSVELSRSAEELVHAFSSSVLPRLLAELPRLFRRH